MGVCQGLGDINMIGIEKMVGRVGCLPPGVSDTGMDGGGLYICTVRYLLTACLLNDELASWPFSTALPPSFPAASLSMYTRSRAHAVTASSQSTGHPWVVKRLWEEGQGVDSAAERGRGVRLTPREAESLKIKQNGFGSRLSLFGRRMGLVGELLILCCSCVFGFAAAVSRRG